MEQITAKITLTKAEWSLLSLCFTHSTYMLPKSCWEVTDTIAKEIENSLDIAKGETNE